MEALSGDPVRVSDIRLSYGTWASTFHCACGPTPAPRLAYANRQGLGTVRHVDTQTLWAQQVVRTGRVDLRKVDGEKNPADLLTKHSLSRDRLEVLVGLHGCKYIGGRAGSAPKMRKGTSTKVAMAEAEV